MPESLPQNNDPLNQAAKQQLLTAQVAPDPTQMYVIQLAEWAATRPEMLVPQKIREQVMGTLELLRGHRNQDQALRFLTMADDQEGVILLPKHLADRTPLEAGEEILEALSLKMSATVPDYPESNPVP